jgi:hypothetical protein
VLSSTLPEPFTPVMALSWSFTLTIMLDNGHKIIYINSLGLSVIVTPDGQWPRTVV